MIYMTNTNDQLILATTYKYCEVLSMVDND
jgi:hypothetical protein